MSGYAVERLEFSKRLADGGIDDALVLPRETAAKIQSASRLELLAELTDGPERTQDELARALDRETAGVCEDLNVLFEAGIIEFSVDGTQKYPVLTHETICVEPLVMHGEMLPDKTET